MLSTLLLIADPSTSISAVDESQEFWPLPNGKDRESCPTEEGEGDEAKGEHVVSDEAKEISGGSRAMTGGLFFASKGG